ncbi:hypothetical protein ACVIJ6_000073 [Bradyrhizobium sp. USDA 4369]
MVSAALAVIALSWLMAAAPAAARSREAGHPHAVPGPSRNEPAMATVPLPQPRPEAAPPRVRAGAAAADSTGTDREPAAAKGEPGAARQAQENAGNEAGTDAKSKAKPDANADPRAPQVPQPSACRLALTEEIAVAPSIPPIKGPGACGGDDLVRLEAVVLPDKRRVAVTPAAVMRCPMASAIASWVRSDVVPLLQSLGSPLAVLDNFDAYECRGRNRVSGAQLSEHGRANAIDVRGFRLADGRLFELTDRTQPRELREAVLHSVCTRFTTVLGPDSDWYHEDHIHLDLAERRSNYRICQWDVLDPLPQIAPLMPAVRPDGAPPRETAEGAEEGNVGKPARGAAAGGATPAEPQRAVPSEPGSADAAAADAEEAETATPPPAPQPAPAKAGKRKHRSRS